jgi:hypothetical protein
MCDKLANHFQLCWETGFVKSTEQPRISAKELNNKKTSHSYNDALI